FRPSHEDQNRMPFFTRNENQSQVRYAAPARPITAITGAPPTTANTPAPAATAAARVPLRLATTLLRWMSEEAIPRRLHHGMPPVKPRGCVADRTQRPRAAGHDRPSGRPIHR